ncbi:MAG TPA: hypothetical protein VKB79_18210 [Bryobacteraceae bacterium]|nr:hypothetical protein [Bryobacteraceae bacterium]
MKRLLIFAGSGLMLLSGVVAIAFAQGNSPAQFCDSIGVGPGSPSHSACVVCFAQGLGDGELTVQCLCKILVADGEYPNVGACHKAFGK